MIINVLPRMSSDASDANSENGKSIVSLRKTDLELCRMMLPSDRCRHSDVDILVSYNSDDVEEYSDDNQCLPLFSFRHLSVVWNPALDQAP